MTKKPCPFCQKEVNEDAFKCKHCGAWFSNDAETKQKELDKEAQVEKLLQQGKDKAGEGLGEGTTCFSISSKKFIVMSVVTYGIYEVYWYFRNWRAIKLQENKKISPFWRAVFSVLFCYTLFKRILLRARTNGYKEKTSPGNLTALYIFFVIVGSKAPFPFDMIGILSFIPLLYVNSAIRFNNMSIQSDYQEHQPLTKGEGILIFIGILIWALTILDLLAPIVPETGMY